MSWIICTSMASEHPNDTPADGAAFVTSKIDAIASDPDVWAKTAFILNNDENEGPLDHVIRRPRRRARRRSSSPRPRLAAPRATAFRPGDPHLAVDGRWLGVQRAVRPHVDTAVPQEGPGSQSRTSPSGAATPSVI
ncbi:alkaline phosphatase family protein [Amycolatopsis sp. FDAARGOS 1241]|uniref:alkaline phosphatase family protein n=1 Tax=Amycolatopsis sp. FDAARGOS 1241 TaxID=2778070 RepID=UPI00351C0FEB